MTGHNRANVISTPDYEKILINERRYFLSSPTDNSLDGKPLGVSSVLLGTLTFFI